MNRFVLSLLAVVVVAGCGTQGSTNVTGPSGKRTPEPGALAGRWKGSIEIPEKKDDPGNAMARGMADMMSETLSLEFPESNRFRLSMMGMPVEGKFALEGNALTLTPELIAGLPPEEAAKQNQASGTANDIERFRKPMKGTLSDDKKSIAIAGDKPDDGKLVFTFVEPRKVGPDSVSVEEKAWVGFYKPDLSSLDESKLTEDQRKQLPMMKSVLGASSLELAADNVAEVNLVMAMQGKWKLKDGKVVIEFPKQTSESGSSQTEPMTLIPQSDAKSLELVNSGGGPSIRFVRS